MSVSAASSDAVQATCPVAGEAADIGDRFVQFFGADIPTDLYREARANAPVVYSPKLKSWFVTGTEEIRAVLRDPKRYSSRKHWVPMDQHPEVQAILNDGLEIINTFTSDPPRHVFMRNLIGQEFHPTRIASKEPMMRALAHELIDSFEHKGAIDINAEFSDTYCMTIMGDIVGYPREDQALLKKLEFGYIQVALAPGSLEEKKQHARDHMAHREYFAELIRKRRDDPRDDLISKLAAVAESDREYMDLGGMVGECMSFQIAGHSTPVQCIGFLMESLIPPGGTLGDADCSSETLTAGFEEIVRLTLLGYYRTTTEPVELGGHHLGVGERVYLVIAAANRAEETFGCPEFDAYREKAQQHLGFGWGRHFCVGAHLARAEARVALQVLQERLPGLHMEPGFTPDYLPNSAFRKIKERPVRWKVTS